MAAVQRNAGGTNFSGFGEAGVVAGDSVDDNSSGESEWLCERTKPATPTRDPGLRGRWPRQKRESHPRTAYCMESKRTLTSSKWHFNMSLDSPRRSTGKKTFVFGE